MLSECQTAWIRMRRRVTRRLIQFQAVFIWHYSRAWQSKDLRFISLETGALQFVCYVGNCGPARRQLKY